MLTQSKQFCLNLFGEGKESANSENKSKDHLSYLEKKKMGGSKSPNYVVK